MAVTENPFSGGSSEASNTSWVISCHLQPDRRALVCVCGGGSFLKGRRNPALCTLSASESSAGLPKGHAIVLQFAVLMDTAA